MGLKQPSEVENYYLEATLASAICIFGLIANVLSGVVLSLKELRCPFSILLLGLTLCDTVFLLCSQICTVIYLVDHTAFHLMTLIAFIAVIGQTGSIYCTLAISFERFIAITWPLGSRARLTLSRSKLIVGGVLILAFFLNIPLLAVPWEEYLSAPEQLSPWVLTAVNYLLWFRIAFIFIVPLAILLCVNVLIYIGIQKAKKNRVTLTTQQKDESSITSILLCIVLVFGICYLPTFILRVGSSSCALYDSRCEHGIAPIMEAIAKITVLVNSSVNFIIYFLTGHKFRSAFVRLCLVVRRRLCCQVPPPSLPFNASGSSSVKSITLSIEQGSLCKSASTKQLTLTN